MELIRQQRSDGGWGQLANLPSDAYATGHSLFVLMETGSVPALHPKPQCLSVIVVWSRQSRRDPIARASLLQGVNRGEPALVANHSERSPLVRFVSDQVEDLEMPPLGKRDQFPPLTKEQTARLRAWIDQGAVWPAGVTLQAAVK